MTRDPKKPDMPTIEERWAEEGNTLHVVDEDADGLFTEEDEFDNTDPDEKD
jgi:hypothetical protein